jgi:AraC-like DNA-binding protein
MTDLAPHCDLTESVARLCSLYRSFRATTVTTGSQAAEVLQGIAMNQSPGISPLQTRTQTQTRTQPKENGQAGQVAAIRVENTPAPIRFAHNSSLLPFTHYLDEKGAPTQRWLNAAHMPMMCPSNSDGLVPLPATYHFLGLAANEPGFENLGAAAALQASVYKLGAFGRVLSRSSTVLEYLQLGSRLVTTLSSGGTRFWLREEDDRLRIAQYLLGPDSLGTRVADVFTLVLTIETLRNMLGPSWLPEELCLRTGSKGLFGEWLTGQSEKTLTGQKLTSFTLPLSLLRKAGPANDSPGQAKTYREQPAKSLMPEDFVVSMEYLVDLLVCDGQADIHNAAETAGLSLRTLQRKLAECGTSYRRIHQSVLLRVAQQRLSESSMRVTDIAAELGYTDASNFARAFQSQTGLSPSKYRLAFRE